MTRRSRYATLALLLGASLLLAACGTPRQASQPAPARPGDGQPMTLTVLHVNDHHSHLDERPRRLALDLGAGPVAVQADAGGFPRIAAAIAELAAGEPNVLTLHAGDAMTGTLYFDRAGKPGQADAALMNTVCFDAMTAGNHEFDKGDAALKRFVDFLHAGDCRTAVLSANLEPGAASPLHPARSPGLIRPSVVFERGGQSIGLVGLTIAGKTQRSSRPDPGTRFTDEAQAAQAQIDALRAQGVSRIVLLSHVGYGRDLALAAQLRGVDVVVGGDSHTLLGPDELASLGLGSPAGSYPTEVRGRDGQRVCVVQAWEHGQIVGKLSVRFDARGEVESCVGRPHMLIGERHTIAGGPGDAARAPTPPERDAIRAAIAASGVLRVQRPDPAALAILQPYRDKVEGYARRVAALAPQTLCLRRVPGKREEGAAGPGCAGAERLARQGGDVQQMVAQAYLDVARARLGSADFTLQSAGGVRIALPAGKVTAADLITALPFGSTLWRLSLTPADIRDMLEDGLQAVFGPGGTTGPYPYTGGLRWQADARQPYGQRISAIEIQDPATGVWKPLAQDRSYTLVTPDFNARGGDGYAALARIPAGRRGGTGLLDVDAMQAWLDLQDKDPATGLPLLRRPPDANYSTRAFVE